MWQGDVFFSEYVKNRRLCSAGGCGEEVRDEHAGRYDDRHGRTALIARVGKRVCSMDGEQQV